MLHTGAAVTHTRPPWHIPLLHVASQKNLPSNSTDEPVTRKAINDLKSELSISYDDGVKITGPDGTAKVVKADLKATNGIIHIIDTVLLPVGIFTTDPTMAPSPSPSPSPSPPTLVNNVTVAPGVTTDAPATSNVTVAPGVTTDSNGNATAGTNITTGAAVSTTTTTTTTATTTTTTTIKTHVLTFKLRIDCDKKVFDTITGATRNLVTQQAKDLGLNKTADELIVPDSINITCGSVKVSLRLLGQDGFKVQDALDKKIHCTGLVCEGLYIPIPKSVFKLRAVPDEARITTTYTTTTRPPTTPAPQLSASGAVSVMEKTHTAGLHGGALDGKGRFYFGSVFGAEVYSINANTKDASDLDWRVDIPAPHGEADNVAIRLSDATMCWTSMARGEVRCRLPDGEIKLAMALKSPVPIRVNQKTGVFYVSGSGSGQGQ